MPLVIALAFWVAGFLFVLAGFSGSLGFLGVTGNVVANENGVTVSSGAQNIAILILFFSNIVTLFFLIRALSNK